MILCAWVKAKHSSRYTHYYTNKCVITDTVHLLGTSHYTNSIFRKRTSHFTDANVFTLLSALITRLSLSWKCPHNLKIFSKIQTLHQVPRMRIFMGFLSSCRKTQRYYSQFSYICFLLNHFQHTVHTFRHYIVSITDSVRK